MQSFRLQSCFEYALASAKIPGAKGPVTCDLILDILGLAQGDIYGC